MQIIWKEICLTYSQEFNWYYPPSRSGLESNGNERATPYWKVNLRSRCIFAWSLISYQDKFNIIPGPFRASRISSSSSSSVVNWPSTRPNMPFQSDAPEGSDTFQWPVIERNRVGEFGWRNGARKKSHDTLIDWCTGREWPVNCMTVISAWWRANMPFQRLSGRLSGWLNDYITRCRQQVRELEIRRVGDKCGGESHHQAEGALGTPDGVWGPGQLVIRCSRESQQSGPPGLRLSIKRTRKTQRWWP